VGWWGDFIILYTNSILVSSIILVLYVAAVVVGVCGSYPRQSGTTTSLHDVGVTFIRRRCVLSCMGDPIKWRCLVCDRVNTATDERHSMDYCECGESWIDYEGEYSRRSPMVEYIDE